MTAVSGVRRQIRELVDGTIEVRVHIDPPYRQQFLKMFPSIDMPIALAPLMMEPTPEPKPAFVPGDSVQKAGLLCKDMEFHAFWRETHGEVADNEDEQAAFLRAYLGVKSRSDIDKDPAISSRFAALVREFEAWRKWA